MIQRVLAGAWTIRVGAMGPSCGTSWYHNPGTVPYTLDVVLSH